MTFSEQDREEVTICRIVCQCGCVYVLLELNGMPDTMGLWGICAVHAAEEGWESEDEDN